MELSWRLPAIAGLLASSVLSGCAVRAPAALDYGIPPCPAGAEQDLLSSDALQCWFAERHGRWRILGHQSHLEALVVETAARDLRDGLAIARRIVASESARAFSEILVYVREERARRVSRVRRIRWADGAFQTLDYSIDPEQVQPCSNREPDPERDPVTPCAAPPARAGATDCAPY